MCSSLNGCDGIGAPEFGWWSIGTITAFAASSSCIDQSPLVRWVDFDTSFSFAFGTFSHPLLTLADAIDDVPSGGHIIIRSGDSSETLTISKPLTIHTWQFPSSIGE